jgi:hypothetical protein
VKYYELKSNPASKVGNMGKSKNGEMLFWTKDEYLKFSDSMMDKELLRNKLNKWKKYDIIFSRKSEGKEERKYYAGTYRANDRTT